jgi:hypothetical protein
MIDETPTAFPWTHDKVTCTGMTLRDYFAAKAMPILISDDVTCESVALNAYRMADAMLKARQ